MIFRLMSVQVFSLYIFKQIVAANPFAKDSL